MRQKKTLLALPPVVNSLPPMDTQSMDIQTPEHSFDQTAISMKDLLAKADFDLPKVGQVIHGTVISVSKNSVLVDLGAIGTGIVYPGEFYDNPSLQKALAPGQEISTVLLDIEDEDAHGYRELSLRQAQQTTAWEDIREKRERGDIITTTVMNINKGGLIVEINGVQGFLPLSQLAPEHYPKVEGGDTTKIVQALQRFRNENFKVKIIDFSEKENKLIVSEKAINEEQLKAELARLSIGDVVHGKITDVTDFGAFMLIHIPPQDGEATPDEHDIPPTVRNKIEGLIHISEIDWKMIDNPRDILSPGQEVDAKVISIENSKVSLSLKALKEDPWLKADALYKPGQTVDGKIAKTTSYGALVSMDESITGLIPISEFRGRKPSDVLTIGETYPVTIISLDPKEHKMLLRFSKVPEAISPPSMDTEKSQIETRRDGAQALQEYDAAS